MVAFQAVLLTLALMALGIGLFWWFVVRPLVGKAGDVMERADKSYELECERERLSEEERLRAEEELKQQLGETPHVDDK